MQTVNKLVCLCVYAYMFCHCTLGAKGFLLALCSVIFHSSALGDHRGARIPTQDGHDLPICILSSVIAVNFLTWPKISSGHPL